MSTIPSTVAQFNKDFCKFHAVFGNLSHTQEQIAGCHKALTLRYLGLQNASDAEIETCAMHLEIATNGATSRGWLL